MEEFFRYMRLFHKKFRFGQNNIGIFAGPDPFTGSERDKKVLNEFVQVSLRSQELAEVRTTEHVAFSSFVLVISPREGHYKGGTFKFLFKLPENYKQQPPVVKCLNQMWHPNITEEGEIRAAVLECKPEEDWGANRGLSDVINCLEKMLTDVQPTENPLNEEASIMLRTRTQLFRIKAALYVWMYAR